jgi:hypothetical protein
MPTTPPIETTQDLVVALLGAGASVQDTQILPAMAGLPNGKVFLVGNERVDVYEFETAAAREQALAGLLDDGQLGPDLWSSGRLIVAYGGTDGATIALLSGFMGDVVDLPGGAAGAPYPPAVAAAMSYVAAARGIDPGSLAVLQYEAEDWPDGCLGLGQANESCAAVVTPGWKVVLELEGSRLTLRTDELGTTVRAEP